MRSTFFIQTIQYGRRICDNCLTAFFLTVQNTQGVLFKTFFTGRAQFIQIVADEFAQLFVVSAAAFRTTQAVHTQLYAVDAHFFQQCCRNGNGFCILCRAVRTQHFHTKLVELTLSACLCVFTTEGRGNVIQLCGLCVVVHTMFDIRTNGTCCTFGTQCQASVTVVCKGIHFFLYDVGCFPYTSDKKFCKFKGRCSDFPNAKCFTEITHFAFDALPCFYLCPINILCTFYQLNHNFPPRGNPCRFLSIISSILPI